MPDRKKKGYWRTNDGRFLKPKDFEDDHLINTIGFIEKKAAGIALRLGTGMKKEEIIKRLYPMYDDLTKELNRRIGKAPSVDSKSMILQISDIKRKIRQEN
jgi:hypothetical protein